MYNELDLAEEKRYAIGKTLFRLAGMTDAKIVDFWEYYRCGSPADYVDLEDAGWNSEEEPLAAWLMKDINEVRKDLLREVSENPWDISEAVKAYCREGA